ncbi:alpha/beta hydrolase family protein [Gimesia panareensis]|uniref:alpha/beta hydrolase family protein n=1 Tax=Gimesia panareensis TaxID=2527978 RepID=UPI001E393605|nr:dienelactone hydrolase [Gimesia panareensis]
MMKYLPLCLLLFCSCFQFTESAHAETKQYNPLQQLTKQTSPLIDLTIKDQKRNRDIPLRIYLPKAKQPAPVVLFSHGLGGARTGSQYLGEHWSARGYVVVYLQHAGSDEAVWKDVPLLQRLRALKSATTLQNTVDRYQDVSAVLDQLTQWNADPQHQFHNRFDLDHIGMSGHSYGAVTTQGVSGQNWRLVGKRYTDPRIKAAVMFSPSSHGRAEPADSFGQVSIPWMLLTGTKDTSPINDTTVADRRKVYQGLPDSIDKYELVLFDAQHSAFSDGRQRRGQARRNPNHHKSILAVTTAFWDTYLRDSKQARQWLQGKACRQQLDPQDEWQFEVSKAAAGRP